MSEEKVSPIRGRTSVRVLNDLLAELVDVDGSDVIVLAIVPHERRPATTEARRRPVPHHHVHRPAVLSAAKEPPPDSCFARLTRRERAVAILAGQALTNQQIARRLSISPHTVNFHLRQIFKKLAIESRVSLAQMSPVRPSVVDSAREHRASGGDAAGGGLRQ